MTINYYNNTAGGKTGDACNACGGAVLASNTFWATPAYYAVCTTWPGHSGDNSMSNGICGAGNSFAIDQRITCDCSGTITNKAAYVNSCVVDNPTNMCAQISNYVGCPPS